MEDIKDNITTTDTTTEEDMMFELLESFAKAFDKMQMNRIEARYGKDNIPSHFIKCTKIEVSEVYIYIKPDKTSEEIYDLICDCNSEDDVKDILSKNGINCIDTEEEYPEYKSRFNVDEVEEC